MVYLLTVVVVDEEGLMLSWVDGRVSVSVVHFVMVGKVTRTNYIAVLIGNGCFTV